MIYIYIYIYIYIIYIYNPKSNERFFFPYCENKNRCNLWLNILMLTFFIVAQAYLKAIECVVTKISDLLQMTSARYDWVFSLSITYFHRYCNMNYSKVQVISGVRFAFSGFWFPSGTNMQHFYQYFFQDVFYSQSADIAQILFC